MKRVPVVVAFLLYILVVFEPIKNLLYDRKVLKYGKVIHVTLIRGVGCGSSLAFSPMPFSYNGKTYSLRVSPAACEQFHSGQVIKLKYLSGYENNFLFPDGGDPIEYQLYHVIAFAFYVYFIYLFLRFFWDFSFPSYATDYVMDTSKGKKTTR
jgi:hypothetical protein